MRKKFQEEPLFGPAAFVVCIHRCDVAVLNVMILLDVLLTGPSDSAATSLQSITYHQDCRIVDTD